MAYYEVTLATPATIDPETGKKLSKPSKEKYIIIDDIAEGAINRALEKYDFGRGCDPVQVKKIELAGIYIADGKQI
jgi:hypothetical protein